MKSLVDLHGCLFVEGPTMLPQNSVGLGGISEGKGRNSLGAYKASTRNVNRTAVEDERGMG